MNNEAGMGAWALLQVLTGLPGDYISLREEASGNDESK